MVALNTVKTHVTRVLGKLGAANRTEAAAGPGSSAWSPDTAPRRPGNTFG